MHVLSIFLASMLSLGTAAASSPDCDVPGAPGSTDEICSSSLGIEIFGQANHPGPSIYQSELCEEGFDAPKVRNLNGTSLDWWYFDAVAEDGTTSISVVFHLEADGAGFPTPVTDSFPAIQITGSYSNGTGFNFRLVAEEAIVSSAGQGSNGLWRGANGSWTGTPDLSQYQIHLNDSIISGSIIIDSIAPAHAACGPLRAGENIEALPGIGWANSIPDGHATVDLVVNGVPMQFENGNWAVTRFNETLASWYWGHARMGPYSLVWIDSLDYEGTEYASGYLARDGEIVEAECGTIRVRPVGANSTYPPTTDSGIPEALSIEMALSNGQTLRANTYYNIRIPEFPDYTRYAGTINGTIGDESFEGLTQFEQFNFNAEFTLPVV